MTLVVCAFSTDDNLSEHDLLDLAEWFALKPYCWTLGNGILPKKMKLECEHKIQFFIELLVTIACFATIWFNCQQPGGVFIWLSGITTSLGKSLGREEIIGRGIILAGARVMISKTRLRQRLCYISAQRQRVSQ